jgi:hypothetical protein
MTVWLDVDDNGNLDTSEGRNVGLGRLRKALGQNEGAWNPPMMKGKGPVMVKVSSSGGPERPEHQVCRSHTRLRYRNLNDPSLLGGDCLPSEPFSL